MRTGGIPISGNLHILLLLFIIIIIYYYYLLLLLFIIYYLLFIIIYLLLLFIIIIYIYVAIYHQQLQYIINNMGIEYDRMGYFSRIQWDIQRNIFFLRDGEFTIVMCISWGYHGI